MRCVYFNHFVLFQQIKTQNLHQELMAFYLQVTYAKFPSKVQVNFILEIQIWYQNVLWILYLFFIISVFFLTLNYTEILMELTNIFHIEWWFITYFAFHAIDYLTLWANIVTAFTRMCLNVLFIWKSSIDRVLSPANYVFIGTYISYSK